MLSSPMSVHRVALVSTFGKKAMALLTKARVAEAVDERVDGAVESEKHHGSLANVSRPVGQVNADS